MFENRVVRKIFEPKRDDETGDWRKSCSERLPDALLTKYCPGDQIKYSKMAGACFVGESRGAYRILVEKPGEKTPLERPRRRWDYNIRMGLTKSD